MTYTEALNQLKNPCVDDIIQLNCRYTPASYRAQPWKHPELNHGCNLLHSEEALSCYVAAYWDMHQMKCRTIFRSIPFDQLTTTIEIVDWGCGQGIGSMCLIEMLRERDKLNLLKKITLIEPSHEALQRAHAHVEKFTQASVPIIPIEKYLPGSDTNNEIDGVSYEHATIIHIFSNILDIEAIDLQKLASMLPSMGHRQFMMCCGPRNTGRYRIDKFAVIFPKRQILTTVSNAEIAVTRSSHWPISCHAQCFEYTNQPLQLDAIHTINTPISICGRPVVDDYDPMMSVENEMLSVEAGRLLEYLQKIISPNDLVYIKPNINGDTPDIVLIRPQAGIYIFHTFNYNLLNYRFKQDSNKIDYSRIENDEDTKSAPVAVLRTYKENLIRLNLEQVAERVVNQKGYWSVVKVIGYFAKNTTQQVTSYYSEYKHDYEQLIGNDFLTQRTPEEFIKTIGLDRSNSLFDSTIRDSFIRIVSPGWHSYKEGVNTTLTPAQRGLATSHPGMQKVKGSAGSGKTMVMSYRAVNAQLRTNGNILLLTFNLSLVNYLRYRLSQVREDFAWSKFTISNYHQFFKVMANNHDLSMMMGSYDDTQFFGSVKDKVTKYDAIFIDEVQDYKTEWLKILSDFFLAKGGEFVVFGDSTQNIYGHELDSNHDIRIGVVPGVWNERLSQGFRFNNGQLNALANKFQARFFGYQEPILTGVEQTVMDFATIRMYMPQDKSLSHINAICQQIIQEIQMPLKDIVILSETHDIIRGIDAEMHRANPNCYTLTTTETTEQYNELLAKYDGDDNNPSFESDIEAIRRVKKLNFQMATNCLKLSTIHSFKGWESDTVILIVESEDIRHEKEFIKPEVIYTGITRAKTNLFIISLGNPQYDEFFSPYIAKHTMPLIEFANKHGRMQVGNFINKETNQEFKSCIFTNADGERVFVAFANSLGVLTPQQIAESKHQLQVTEYQEGKFRLEAKV